MNFASFEQELIAGLAAVREAAKICRSVQAQINLEHLSKDDSSPVTVADFGSQAVVCKTLGEKFPHDSIVAEEDATELRDSGNLHFLHQIHEQVCANCLQASPDEICRWIDRGTGKHRHDRFWTLDPIDGTKGFLRRQQYAISLALIVDGQIVVGLLGCPNLTTGDDAGGQVFYAVKGGGAFVESLESPGNPQSIVVSKTTNGASLQFCGPVEAGHSNVSQTAKIMSALGATKPVNMLDSQAKYAVVARGEADAYLRLPTNKDRFENIWDHAGGVIVVEEAGGKVTDAAGKRLDFSAGEQLTRNQGVVVSNGLVHDQLLAAIMAVSV
jgi:3'(2'), 5'-bisphosphate nucleotidase